MGTEGSKVGEGTHFLNMAAEGSDPITGRWLVG